MADLSRDEQRERATAEASIWLGRLERTLKEGESTRLRKWLELPLHREVIVEICTLWHGPEILAVLSKLIRVDTARSTALAPPGRIIMLIAAVTSLFFVGLSVMLLVERAPWSAAASHDASTRFEAFYRTPVGARREMELPDGTTITLNTATRLIVTYGPNSRDMTLVIGEASFKVASDPRRPVRLNVGRRTYETNDARFNVRRLTREMSEITVSAGEVKVLSPRHSASKTPAQRRDLLSYSYGEATIRAAEGGPVGNAWQSISALQPDHMAARLAWQQGRMIFANEPLEDALADVARYTATEFVFTDASLRNARLSAEFRTGDLDSVLHVLHATLMIDSRVDARGRVVLSAAH